MLRKGHFARPGLVLFLGIAMTMGCAESKKPKDDAAPDQQSEGVDGAVADGSTEGLPKKSKLLVELPKYCNTPDGMALLADGSFLLSVPNFNNTDDGAMIMKITPDNKAEKFLDLPKHPETGDLVGALGICVAPSGDLFLADYQPNGDRQSRVLKITVKDGKPGKIEPAITGFHVSNAVLCTGGHLYVSETQIDLEAKPATSGVFRFSLEELEKGPVALAENETEDPHFLGIIEIHSEAVKFGADGLCMDKAGNLFCGNFADGTIHRFEFDEDGKVKSNTIFAKDECMKCADGLIMDQETQIIYAADSIRNAIQMIYPDGSVKTLAINGDTDGLDGGMDQPCEPLIRGDEIITSNMDWPIPGCTNTEHTLPATLSVIPKE